MTNKVMRRWLDTGALELPLPGGGQTAERFRRLAALSEADVVAGRLAEAHCDAVAILAELGGPPVQPGQWWGVWAAESPDAVLLAEQVGDRAFLHGTKQWCSGAGLCTHALVTARVGSRQRGLFAVELQRPGVQPMQNGWHNAGMAASDTRSVQFSGAPAVMVGEPGDYLSRPGFWHGAVGVAACWLGGARAVAAALYSRAAGGAFDPHGYAHLGAIDAVLTSAEATLTRAAAQIDANPSDRTGAEIWALRTRAVVEDAVEETIRRTGRALGPAPLCGDAVHAARVADLTVYVRQSHAEKDLERLGELVGAGR
ncbi:acyl-CoA dehydrogenase family protein [Mycolicibacterium sp.]|uniref:acyl-CoA dehydrogenase family protein n=1 Tax=Mycolicibacterium sp. TaxID=2320850 RepID=UPI0037C760B8